MKVNWLLKKVLLTLSNLNFKKGRGKYCIDLKLIYMETCLVWSSSVNFVNL